MGLGDHRSRHRLSLPRLRRFLSLGQRADPRRRLREWTEFHPTEAGLLHARTDVGGAYHHDPATGRWIALNDSIGGLDNAFMELGVASVALDPQDPDRVYLACGQYVARWAPDATVLRSTDRGATWARTTLPFNLDGNSDGRNTGENLVVDPRLGSGLLLCLPQGFGFHPFGVFRIGGPAPRLSRVAPAA